MKNKSSKNDIKDNKDNFKVEFKNIETIINIEIEKINKKIEDLKIQMNKKEDDIKNIINEKDKIIKELGNKIIEQENTIKEYKNDISNLNKKIESIEKNMADDIKNKETKLNTIESKLTSIQNENENIKEERVYLLNELNKKYKNLNFKTSFLNNKINIKQYNRLYRVMVLGPTGAGKSQFCNFVLKDETNSTFDIGYKSKAYQFYHSERFKRLGIDFEINDIQGFNDDYENSYHKYFPRLLDFLKSKGNIDYILFLLNYNDVRFSRDLMNFFEFLAKIFTPFEFFSHISIVYTRYTKFDDDEELETKNNKNILLDEIKKIFHLNKEIQIPEINQYYLNTKIYKDKNKKDKENEFQNIVDIILQQIKIDVDIYDSIDTKNLDFKGNNLKLIIENEKKRNIFYQ